jgi:hypothetical protein
MGKLRDLLAAEADRFRDEKAKRQKLLSEWLGLLNDLFAQIDSWLKASDPEGLLEVAADTQTINDPALGEYQAPTRRVVLGDNSAEIVPRARYVVAALWLPGADQPVRAHGLVEIRARGWATHNLYQLPGGKWYIFSASQENVREDGNRVEPLDAERFEAALASVLR